MGHDDTAVRVDVEGVAYAVSTGNMLWSHAGDRGVATVGPHGHVTVDVIKGAHAVPVSTWGVGGWAPAVPCDYCTRPATHIERESGSPDLYCVHCARDHYSRPSDGVRPLAARDVREAYALAYGE
jgi:hypothetical protein